MKKPVVKKQDLRGNPNTAIAVLPVKEQVQSLLAELKRLGSEKRAEEMATRYGIHKKMEVCGTTMADMQKTARRLGRDHALAAALWDTGW